MKLFIAALIFSGTVLAGEAPKFETCLSSREYITTLEYLREQKAFGLAEKNARDLASKVSEGCTGASKRFIQITNVLVKAGVPSTKVIETAQKFALAEDKTTDAFLTVFKGSFIDSLLDLDVTQALNIALELSLNYSGDKKLAEKNFNQVVEFCMDKKSLDLPVLECARMGARVIRNGAEYDFDIAKDYISLYNYLTEKEKANLPTFEALAVAEYATKYGPTGKENFVQGFEYALSKKGLERTEKDSVEFGKLMASRSVKPTPSR